MSTDYTVHSKIAGDEHESYVRSRIEAILEGMDLSAGGSGTSTPSGSNVVYKEITSDELAAMWES